MFLKLFKPKLKIAAKVISGIVLIILMGYLINYLLLGDNINRINRLGISYLDGDYTITYHAYSGDKVWTVDKGKITTDADKGYYFFWATIKETNKKAYVQIPIQATTIQQNLESI